MYNIFRITLLTFLLGIGTLAYAQSDVNPDIDIDDDIEYTDDSDMIEGERLKMAAIEALISAPAHRAMPIVTRVLRGNDSEELKESALFVLSQVRHPDAEALLIDVARTNTGNLQEEAVRMIGISGNKTTLGLLKTLYRDGDGELREAILQAYLIAGDVDAVVEVIEFAETEEELEDAIQTLGAMGATEQLRALRDRQGLSEALIRAYAIAGDVDTLRELALDDSNPERQADALRGLAIAGGDVSGDLYRQMYRNSKNEDVRDAALKAMMIAGDDKSVLDLFRSSQDPREKRELLELLVMMDSDAVWDIIDATLEDD